MNGSQPWWRARGAPAVTPVALIIGTLIATVYPARRNPAVAERRRGGAR